MRAPSSPAGSSAGLRKDPLWNFKLVGAFMPRATAKACEKHGFHAAEIILNWPAIVGADIAAFTAPRRIRWPKAPARDGDVAAVSGMAQRGVKSALEIWVEGGRAHEIPYLKAPIIARINTFFGYRAITDILPVSGPINAKRERMPKIRHAEPGEVKRVQAALQLAQDDPLGEALARLGALIDRKRKGVR